MKKLGKFLIPAAALLLIVGFLLWQNGVFSRENTGKPVGEIHLTIQCEKALSSGELKESVRALLPEDGVMYRGSVTLLEGDTAFTVLERACRSEKIALESAGSTRYGLYVEGVGGLYEMDCGAESGWLFSVNGEFPSESAGNVSLADGDAVVWVYTCDLGRDAGGHDAA